MKVQEKLNMIFLIMLAYFSILVVSLPVSHHLLEVGSSVYGLLPGTVAVAPVEEPSLVATVTHLLVRRGIVSPTNWQLKLNTIAFGVPAFICFSVRIVNRIFVMKHMQFEDYLMCSTIFLYISLLTLINASARYATNLYPDSDAAAILSGTVDVQNRILGSKIVIALEQCMLFTTWGVKICVWCFLKRCCRQLPYYTYTLWALLAFIIVGLIVIEICYWAVFCHPVSQYWAVPVDNTQCATYAHYSIMQACFNIPSDIVLIVIPLYMVYKVKLPAARRVILGGVFSLGFFTIVAAILNKAYNFASPFTTQYQLWYIREASVAVMVGNIICTWQLIQRIFKVRSFDDKHAGIQNDPEVSPNNINNENNDTPTLVTIGGTPRISNGTPGLGFKKRFAGPKDPHASLFDTIRTLGRGTKKDESGRRSRLDTYTENTTGTGGRIEASGYTSDTFGNEKSVTGMGIFTAPSSSGEHNTLHQVPTPLPSIPEEDITPEEAAENYRLAAITPPPVCRQRDQRRRWYRFVLRLWPHAEERAVDKRMRVVGLDSC